MIERWTFGTNNDELVELVLSGKKTATTSLYSGYNDNLPKIRKYFDKNVSSSSKTKDSYSKDIKNSFLKSSGKSLNPVKNKKIVSTSLNFTDKKKYLLYNNKKINYKPKKDLNLMKNFCDKSDKLNKKTFRKKSINEILNKKVKLN